jgi:arsenite-transporting ATPase
MHPRLIIFTGKGGVGKTTLALASALHFKKNGVKVKYNSFYLPVDASITSELDLPIFNLSVEESAELYIAQKLGSKTIASFIMGTHFFKSLFQMIPGLGHMILLGHILKDLELDPTLTIVLDSPASGHALTMFQSSSNFKRIFKTGLIVKDIERMIKDLEDPNFLKTYIVSLPTELSVAEAHEVKSEINEFYSNNSIIINNSLVKYLLNNKIPESELPHFLKNKLEMEHAHTNTFSKVPHIPENDFKNVVIEIEKNLNGVL